MGLTLNTLHEKIFGKIHFSVFSRVDGRDGMRDIRTMQSDFATVLRLQRARRVLASSDARTLEALRDALTRAGFTSNPVGTGNSKVGGPSTYRPVDKTCPSACARLQDGTCYALTGKTALAQSRASAEALPSLLSVLLALEYSKRTDGAPIRLHTSGDFLTPDGEIDQTYIAGLVYLGRAYGGSVDKVLGWSYTHDARTPVHALRKAGWSVRLSDSPIAGGVVVTVDVRALRSSTSSIPVIACPAQRSDAVTCGSCTLCWTRPNSLIAFAPEGGRKGALTRRLQVVA